MAIRRGIIAILGLLLQILLSLLINLYLIEKITLIQTIYTIIGVLLVLALIKNSNNYSYILPWIIIIIIFPIIGTIMYIILGRNKKNSKVLKKIIKSEREAKQYFKTDKNKKIDYNNKSQIRYLSNYAGYPVTINNQVNYYSSGEEAYSNILYELKKAKKFIFFEYFIIKPGLMWDSILNILKEKAEEGLDVRVMYDDLGCMASLKSSFPKELSKYGIKCIVFNKLNPIGGVFMNNRDHRKIIVIDGKIAFSGGINIADEYINKSKKYGYWKDNAIKIFGDAVWNYTIMFLSLWNSFKKEDSNFNKFKYKFKNQEKNNGYVIPYGESPSEADTIAEDVYLNIINQANDYVYIFTPYLIIDNELAKALILATKRGVDVKIIIPGIPDKKVVYTLTESYVELLVKGGVSVYKYTKGFIHSKVFVSDNHIATVGTINLDYRSLYLHFECGCYLEDVEEIEKIEKDFKDALDDCHKITKKEASPNIIKAIWQALLRLIAPLM